MYVLSRTPPRGVPGRDEHHSQCTGDGVMQPGTGTYLLDSRWCPVQHAVILGHLGTSQSWGFKLHARRAMSPPHLSPPAACPLAVTCTGSSEPRATLTQLGSTPADHCLATRFGVEAGTWLSRGTVVQMWGPQCITDQK